MPSSQRTTAAIDAGLELPMETEAGSRAPISTTETTMITIDASSTGMSEPTRWLSGRLPRTKKSQMTRVDVCTAMPPMRLPATRSRLPASAPETVTASSGRLPATASRIMPPRASPRPKRMSIASVVRER
jgi:hypothetical protein